MHTLQQQACSRGLGRLLREHSKSYFIPLELYMPFVQHLFGSMSLPIFLSEFQTNCALVLSFPSLSESFFMVKGAALFLQQGNSPQGQRSLQHPHKHAGNLSFSRWSSFSVLQEEPSIPGVGRLLVFKARETVGPGL